VAINRVVPNIQSAKAAESKEFYADTLGFNVAMDQGWLVGFASPTNPTAQIQVLAADATAPVVPALSIEADDVDALYATAHARRHHRLTGERIKVDDVDAPYATVQARGYAIVYPLTDEPWGVRRFFTRDPQGFGVNIVSHRAAATPAAASADAATAPSPRPSAR